MIGSFIAAYFVGKKPVAQSLIFWGVLLVIGWVLAAYALGEGTIMGLITNFVIGFFIFVGLALIYLKVDFKTSIVMYIVALVINIAIGLISGVAFGLANVIMQMV